MIRFFYWVLVVIEIILLLGALLLFIVTDSRTIKFIAQTSLNSSKFTYQEIEGNLFKGLKIENLAYDNQKLFTHATLHWNPFTLFYNKVTITKIDAIGIEVDSIIHMAKELGSTKSKNGFKLDFSFSFDSSHFDINPYVYEGVKLSSFVLETGKIELDRDLTLNTKALNLKFDTDIVNVDLEGEVKDSRLLIENLNLKNISSRAITLFTKRLRAKYKDRVQKKSSSDKFVFFKEIKIKHILGSMKPIKYGELEIQKATLLLEDGEVDPYHNYHYKVKDLKFKGKTNFGSLSYKGYVDQSTIHAKGEITLDKRLFSRYSLPLNFKSLRKLPSTLKLNHSGVWVNVEHSLKNLLKLKNDFNIDIAKGEHQLSYLYGGDLIIDSQLKGKISYADKVELQSKTVIDFHKKSVLYKGVVELDKFKKLPPKIAPYLLKGLKGEFLGDKKGLIVDIESNLLKGKFETPLYKRATLTLNSKEKNLELSQLIDGVDSSFKNEKIALESTTFLDFKESKKSNIEVNLYSNLLNAEVKGNPSIPLDIALRVEVPKTSKLREINKKIKFDQVKNLRAKILLAKENYKVDIRDISNNATLTFKYNIVDKTMSNGRASIANEEIFFSRKNRTFSAKADIGEIYTFLTEIGDYYRLRPPTLRGDLSFKLRREEFGLMSMELQSKHLKILKNSKSSRVKTDLYNLSTSLDVDKAFNIEMKHYRFKVDDNDYITNFFSDKSSKFTFKESKFTIKNLWINDALSLKGTYNSLTEKGKFKIDAQSYKFSNKEFNLKLNLNLDAKIDKSRVDIDGDVNILEGEIYYELEGSSIVEDADIVIVKNKKLKEESALKDLKLYIKLHNKKPLKYLGKDIEIEFYNDLSIVKSFNQDMFVTGMMTITKGYYQLEDKRFLLDESHLYFAGDVKKPLLDIKANYEKEQYTVHVFISGTTDAPIVNFNSDPYLTQQEILSLILFDGTGSSSGKGAEAYTLLGGTFAKGLIKSLGINVDHLLLGNDANDELSLEIGRKISKDITVLYLHKDGLDGAKVRIEHSRDFETDIIIQPPNTSSIEFLYKQDR